MYKNILTKKETHRRMFPLSQVKGGRGEKGRGGKGERGEGGEKMDRVSNFCFASSLLHKEVCHSVNMRYLFLSYLK
jgi:hypothetical protein